MRRRRVGHPRDQPADRDEVGEEHVGDQEREHAEHRVLERAARGQAAGGVERWSEEVEHDPELTADLGLATAHIDAFVPGDDDRTVGSDPELDRVVSELRLVKDAYEVAELRGAVDATRRGFDDIVAELRTHVRKEIGPIATPRQIMIVAELPKTRSGKIMRRLLKDVAEDREVGDVTTLADSTVMDLISDNLKDGGDDD